MQSSTIGVIRIMLKRIKLVIPKSEHPHFVRFALVFAGIIVSWAIIHDLYLMHVEPRHFTEYHRQILPVRKPTLLALQYGFIATFGPGLVFGFFAYFACRGGHKNKVDIRRVAIGFLILVTVVEGMLLSLGYHARAQFMLDQTTFYPAKYYPELTAGIVFTQTVNLSAYLFAPALGSFYLLFVYLRRG